MTAGMPVVALDTTDARRAVIPGVGAISTDVRELHQAVRAFIDDPERGRDTGERAREWALERFGLARFQADRAARPSRSDGAATNPIRDLETITQKSGPQQTSWHPKQCRTGRLWLTGGMPVPNARRDVVAGTVARDC